MSNWFVVRNDKEHGPFTDGQLKKLASSGKITSNDRIRRDGMTNFVKAGVIKGLFPDNNSATPAAKDSPAPPPLPTEHPPQKTSGPRSPLQKLRGLFEVNQEEATLKAKILRSVKLLFGIALMIPFVILVITNALGLLSVGFEAFGGGVDLEKVQESEIVKAPALSTLYKENEAAADNEFKGKTLFIEGYVIEVAKKSGATTIALDEDYADNGPGYVIVCALSSSAAQSPALSSIRRGTKILIGGQCEGKKLSTYFVRISGCEFKVLESSIYR